MTRCHPRSVHVADIDATRHPVDPARQPGPDAKTHAIFVWRHRVSPADAARAHLVNLTAKFADRQAVLAHSITRAEAAQVTELGAQYHASTNRTCELGMTRATGRVYRHVLELLEESTR